MPIQLNTRTILPMLLLLLAFFIFIGVSSIVTDKTGDTYGKDSNDAPNETQANTANGTVYTLQKGDVDPAQFRWYQQNGTANGSVAVTLLNSANYTLTVGTHQTPATVQLTSNAWNNGNATWDYLFYTPSAGKTAADNGTKGLVNWASYNPLVGTLLGISIVLGILFGLYVYMGGRRGGGDSGGSYDNGSSGGEGGGFGGTVGNIKFV